MSQPIQPGQPIPEMTLIVAGEKGPEPMPTAKLFSGKKVALFAVPGAFTPTCSIAHLPGYVTHAAELKAKGVDTIACLSVNDAFVMRAWQESQNAGEVLMISDGSGEFANALGLSMDASAFGMGLRAQRFSMLIEDGVVKTLNIEKNPSKAELSGAEHLLSQL